MDELQLFSTPEVDLEDSQVIDGIRAMRASLAEALRVPRRWSGGLRRTTQARAIRGSNTIEGYIVSAEDEVAAVDEERAPEQPDPIRPAGPRPAGAPYRRVAGAVWGRAVSLLAFG